MKTQIIILLFLFLNGCSINNEIKEVCFKEQCFNVEIADSDLERENGLMNRNSLERDKGMLFVFEKEEIYPFWIKDTLIPLDILWINENKEVVYIKENAGICVEKCEILTPDQKASYVLEINSGITKELGIKKGDK